MSSSGTMSVASNCPIFDGTYYPYWKNKMRMHLEAIDKDLWDIVEQGISEANLMTTPDTVKKNWQLDAKARSIIGGHLNKAQFNRTSGWILQRRYGQDCQKLMKESLPNETHELIHFAVSSIGSRGWITSTCNKPLTDSLIYPMNFKHWVPLISQIMRS